MRDDIRIRQTRLAAIVMLVTVLVWFGASILGGKLGWPAEYALLADLAALGGFAFAIVTFVRVWLAGRNEKG